MLVCSVEFIKPTILFTKFLVPIYTYIGFRWYFNVGSQNIGPYEFSNKLKNIYFELY